MVALPVKLPILSAGSTSSTIFRYMPLLAVDSPGRWTKDYTRRSDLGGYVRRAATY